MRVSSPLGPHLIGPKVPKCKESHFKRINSKCYESWGASINDIANQADPLAGLLPESKGFIWRYDGFAEYSHQMQLEFNTIDKVQFLIEGKTGATFGNIVFNEALVRRQDLIE